MSGRLSIPEFAIWTALLVLHRVVILFCGFDGTYFWEESYRVLAATSVWEGWGLTLYDLQADPYAGGSLVMSLLAVPAVAVLGPTLTALKIVGIGWTALGFAFWVIFVSRHVGCAAARAFAILFLLGPPLFLDFNLLVMGSHWETVTLAGAQWLLVGGYVADPDRTNARLIAWGVVAGLSIWFTYISVLVFAACFLFALASGNLPPRRWTVLAGAVTAGLAPWIVYNFATAGSGIEVVTRTFMPLKYAGDGVVHWYLAAVSDLVKKALPRSLQFADVRLGYVYWIVAWSCVAFVCLRTLRTRVVDPVAAQLPFLVASLLLVAASEHTFQKEFESLPFLTYRVVVPILPSVFLLCAAGLTARTTWLRIGALSLLCALGVAATVQATSVGAARRSTLDEGALHTGAEVMGHLLVYKGGLDIDAIGVKVALLPADLRADAYRGVGFALAYRVATDSHLTTDALNDSIGKLARQGAARDALVGVRLALDDGLEHVPPLPPSDRVMAIRRILVDLDPLKSDP